MRPVRPIKRAQSLRAHSTDAERRLWLLLRDRRLGNYKFRRQHPVENYILDFACVGAKLAVEIDGGQHCDNEKDRSRAEALEKQGWRVIRFWNNEIMQHNEAVLQTIIRRLENAPSPSPLPPAGARV